METRQTIKIDVATTGLLHIEGLGKEGSVELSSGATVADLLVLLKIQKDHQKFVTSFINGDEKNHNSPLQDGDRVTLLLPIGGG